MTIGEIREFTIDGKYIRVEYVGENLYVINDVLVCVNLDKGYDLFDSDRLLDLTQLREDPYFPYPGPENDSVIGLSPSVTDPSEFICSYWDLTTFEENVQRRAIDSLRHYRHSLNRA